MSDTSCLLSDGLLQLCHSDPCVDSLITPRRDEVLFLLDKYIAEIESFNPALGLVGTNDRQELIVRHILDSLAPLGIILQIVQKYDNLQIARKLKVADVGSGAGLPGIPLAIVLPNLEFTLIERKGRRAGFLQNTQQTLGLSNVLTEEGEMEKAERGRFEIVTFRAFKPLESKIYKKLIRLCSEGGCLAAYKGRREKITAEMTALEKTLPALAGHWTLTPCPVPFLDEERHLVVVSG